VERDAVQDLGKRLDAMSIEWALFGAVAANRYRREVRLTGDVDLLLADHGNDLAALERSLVQGGWTTRRATPDGAVLRLRHPRLGAADLVLAETEYQRVALARARSEADAAGARVRYLAPEDVILHKLIAGRPRDLDDILNILDAAPTLDETYLEGWADAWDVRELWQRLKRGQGDAG
jgi:hypothetical protein